MQIEKPIIAIVLPCFNEEEVLEGSIEKIRREIAKLIIQSLISPESFILCVDDGSSDNTWSIIKKSNVSGIRFKKNYGHQSAILAGMKRAKSKSDAVITVDADLQDDIGAIGPMVEYYTNGVDIVYGVRNDRTTDSFFKKFTAELFYLIVRVIDRKIIYNHADFRLTSRKAIISLEKYLKYNGTEKLFLRGVFPRLKLKSAEVYYKRGKRQAGVSKYPFIKMVSFAWRGMRLNRKSNINKSHVHYVIAEEVWV